MSLDTATRQRRCILVGAIKSDNAIITESFITPTINYSTWTCSSRLLSEVDILATVTSKCHEFRPYSPDELRVVYTCGTFSGVIISGGLSHIYALLVSLPDDIIVQPQTTSIGSCTLRVQLIRHSSTVPSIDDVCVNGAIVSSLLDDSNESSAYRVIQDHNKTSIKFVTSLSGRSHGPRLTVGYNGGIQYIGSYRYTSSSFHTMYTLMSVNMGSPLFIDAIRTSDVMSSYVYPLGVSRS